jgi:hypothetical protein
LPFVLVLTLITTVVAVGLISGNLRSKFNAGRVADQQRHAGLKADGQKQTAQPKTVASVLPTSPLTASGNSVSPENKFRPSGIVPPAPPTTVAQQSPKIPQVVEMTNGQDAEQASQNLPLLRADRVPYSSAMAGERERDRGEFQEQESDRIQKGEAAASNQDVERSTDRKPRELHLTKAHDFNGDLRNLPRRRPVQQERPELEGPAPNPRMYVPPGDLAPQGQSSNAQSDVTPSVAPQASAPAPAPLNVFEGLDRFNWGAGSPPDTNGDVGPNHYIQTVNTSIGVFRKTDGFQLAAFTFNTFMSQGNFGNQCDTNNFGDPVVVYDTFEDRWVISDFAFTLDGGGNVNPAIAYQCFAVSKTGDPVTGGWNFYSIAVTDGLNDYPKLGVWTDGIYMSSNVFGYAAGASFKNARVWAFNKAQMYAGSPTVKIVSFDVGGGDFTVIPGNARLQTGTPPAGRANLFLSSQLFLNALTVYKFHVDWNNISLSTFTGPDIPVSATSWPTFAGSVPQSGTSQTLDSLSNRAMVQNQYTNFGGTESLWVSHTVRRQNTSGFGAPRWYQVNVTGGTVANSIPQAATWDPDGANVLHRWMPSLALDRAGNLAMGYSTSSSSTFPSIKYAGRLAADPVNTFSQTEQTFFTGTASQLSSTRWGDYSAMTLDPDGCTFWYTTEYATGLDTPPVPPQTVSPGFNQRWKTKFGNIGAFPGCTPVGAGGTVSGTVTVNPSGTPISGATVNLGSGRSTTTDGSGNYSFSSIPAGTYPSMDASKPGYSTGFASSIVVTDGGTTTQNFSLTVAPTSACLTDTTQSDFLDGVPTAVDLNTSPGDVTLVAPTVDQLNTAGTTTGTGFGTPAWTGQTFIAGITGPLVKADVQLFCNGCGATPPNLTLSVRATSAGLPTGADLSTATIPGSTFASGAITSFTATFGSPTTVTSGTQYALILRPVSAPAGSGYFWIRSSPSTYASGSRMISADSGGTWSADTTRDYNFKTYIQTYNSSGTLISSTKDANPAAGITPIWSTFSWNGTTPANTSLKFQIAGSNNVNGPFTFVGPDGTAGTFFTTSPVNLQPQFYNFRYLEYKAFLATTDPNVTPTLSDATFCFNDVDCSSTVATITPTPAAVCASSTGNTASGPAGMTTYAWGITNGTITSATNTQSITYTAGASGTVTLNLTVTAPNGCIVSGSQPVTINPIPPTPTVTPGGPTTFCAGGSVLLTSSNASGNQWFLNGNPIGGATAQTYSATASGSYTVVTTLSGCSSATSGATVVTVTPLPPTPTITPAGSNVLCTSLLLTSSSATGNQWYLNGNPIGGATAQTYSATAAGSYTVVVTASGCASAPSAATTLVANTPPVLTYQTQTTSFKGALAINPATGPSDDVSVSSIAVQSVGTYTGTISVNNTTGVVSVSNAGPVGSHTITIRATDSCGTTTDASFTLTVQKAATTTALSSSPNPSALSQNVTFTAAVTSTAGTPTGTVTFKDGASPISCTNAGGQTLNGSGVATCQTAALTAGPHTITADYSGDTNFVTSTGTLSGGQTVNNRPLISLSASTYSVNEADGFIRITVNRSGDTAPAVTVDYATDDTGASTNCATLNTTLASSRCDYETMLGTLQFAATETQKTVDIPINRDAFTEGPESFTVNLANVTGGGGTLINPSSATVTINDSASPTPNAIDDADLFVKQQYHDFLNREPDAAGLAFWVNGLNACSDPAQRPAGQTQAQCIEVRRILTSGAFFLSIEFMQSGTFVRNAYVAALDRPATNNMPGFTEWLRDTQAVQRGVIVGQGSWQATLDANRTAFLNDFVTRAEFIGLYPTTDTPTQYVDKLYLHAAVTPGSAQERTDAIAEFGAAATASDTGARGRALARILQNAAFRAREINRAFVQMEYFGYLRRNPNDPPDNNFNGYNFWVTKLNAFNGDFFAAEMVKGFLSSDEYRKRFGQ